MHVQWEAPYWTALLYMARARGLCACPVGGSLLDSVALYCEC